MRSATSSSIALRSVPIDTLKRCASRVSEGSASPGRHSPAAMLPVSRRLTSMYRGEKAAVSIIWFMAGASLARKSYNSYS